MSILSGKVKFILHALGTNGEVFPVLGIAKALIQAGYSVVVLSNDKFKNVIEGEGVPFYSTGAVGRYYTGNTSEVYRSGNWSSHFQYYLLPAFKPSFSFVKSEYEKSKNIIVISCCKNNGARAAADVLSIPAIDLVLSPSRIPSVHDLLAPLCWNHRHKFPAFYHRWLLKKSLESAKGVCVDYATTLYVNRERRELGALPYGKNNNKIEKLSLGLFAPWFTPRAIDWPDHFQAIGFPLSYFTQEKEAQLVNDFISQNGAPVVFSFGSGVHDLRALQKHCFKICNQLNVPGIFTGSPENIAIEEMGQPHLLLKEMNFMRDLPKCRAIVHHGGIGTVGQAIKSRVPQLIRPLRPDHVDNAYRVNKLGVGDYLLPKGFSVEAVTEKLRGFFSSPSPFRNSEIYRDYLDENTVFERIVSEIEQLYMLNGSIS